MCRVRVVFKLQEHSCIHTYIYTYICTCICTYTQIERTLISRNHIQFAPDASPHASHDAIESGQRVVVVQVAQGGAVDGEAQEWLHI